MKDKELKNDKEIKKYSKRYSNKLVTIFNLLYNKLNESNIDTPYYISYYNILKRTAEVIDSLNINDPISISVAFEYLLWNGYLSKEHVLNFQEDNRICNLGLLGADIMTGKSVCLNNSVMLSDLFKQLGKKAYTFGAYIPCDNEKTENKPIIKDDEMTIKRSKVEADKNYYNKIKILSLLFAKRTGNHAVTLIEENNQFILSDPTNLDFLNISNFLSAKYIGSDLEIKLKPWLHLATDYETKEELDRIIIISSYLHREISPYTLVKVEYLRNETMKICEKSKSILENLYERNVEDIEIVCKTLEKK